jgi:hypothetical protein
MQLVLDSDSKQKYLSGFGETPGGKTPEAVLKKIQAKHKTHATL